MLPDDASPRMEEKIEPFDRRPKGEFGTRFVVGWIEKNKIKRGGSCAWKPRFHGRLDDGRIILQGGYVLPESRGGTKVLFDKEGGSGSPTEGFQSVGTRPGKEIENASLRNESGEGREDSGTDTILGGAEIG